MKLRYSPKHLVELQSPLQKPLQISQAEKISAAMFSSRCLQSEEPFKSIWVAAYFHSKLKKSQILQTDIVSTVDKLLQDDFGVITYRVLAYLLLGVVRIQSKKVGYMSNDCQEILNRIKEFISKKQTSHVADTLHTPYNSITLPDRFELDAFDLDIIEDSSSRSNVMPNEAITLKDTAWKNLEMVQFSLDKCQFEFSASNQDSRFLDDDPPDKDFLSPCMMSNLSNLEASLEKFRDIRFSEEECVHLDKFYGVEEESPILIGTVDENLHNDVKDIKLSKMALVEALSPMETNMEKLGGSGFSPEECSNHEALAGFQEKHSETVKPSGQDFLNIIMPEGTLLESDMPQMIEDETNLSNLVASMEKLQNVTFSCEELPEPDIFCRVEKEPAETILQHDEEKHHIDALHQIDMGAASSENIRCKINTEGQPSSLTPDITSKPKFSDPSACTTPTPMKPIQRRKRKCIIDEPAVLSNQVLKRSIEDPSDLVSKRRKVHYNSLAAQKAYRISSFRNSFLEPLLNCLSVELRPLFSTNKLDIPEDMDVEKSTEEFPEPAETVKPFARILESAEIVDAAEKILVSIEISGTPRQLNVSVPSRNGGPIEEPQIAPETPMQQTSAVRFMEEPQISPETPMQQTSAVRFMEEPQISPETPIRQTSLVRSIGTFTESPFDSDAVTPASLCVSTQNYTSSGEDQELDISLINEEISSRYEDDEERDLSPGRTRIGRILQQRSKEETLNLSRVLIGKTKKDSARVFYEILVLKSRGYLDVEQDCAYGDIHVRRLPRWEQIDGAC